jgi:hypothetical protein
MDAFFLAALTSFSVTMLLLASTATSVGESTTLQIGRYLRIIAVRRAFILVVASFAIFAIVMLILVIIARIHPEGGSIYTWGDFLGGPRFSSVVLGLLFGTLFAFWVRELVKLSDSAQIGPKHLVQVAVLAFLLALGAFSDILRSYANRITQINLGGAQVTLSPLKRRDDDKGSGPGARAQDKSPLEALSLIAGLSNRVDSDVRYINSILIRHPDDAPNLVPASYREFYNSSFGSFAQCLVSFSALSGDEARGEEYMRKLGVPMRELLQGRAALSGTRREQIAKQFADMVGDLIVHLENVDFYQGKEPPKDPKDVPLKKCKDMVVGHCLLREATDFDKDMEWSGFIAQWRGKYQSVCTQRAPERVKRLAEGLSRLQNEMKLQETPYAALLHAGVLWAADQHKQAVNVIDAWLREAEAGKSGPIHEWLLVRARVYIAAIIEDLFNRSDAVSEIVANYHLDNLRKSIELMKPMLRTVLETLGDLDEDIEAKGYGQRPPISGHDCAKLDEDRIRLLLSLTSLHNTFIYRATRQRDYYDKHLTAAISYRRFVLARDFGCIGDNHRDYRDTANAMQAETILSYAAIELASAAKLKSVPDAAAVERALNRANDALDLGLRLIAPAVSDEELRSRNARDYLTAIAPRPVADLKFTLTDLQRKVAEERKPQ